MQKAKFTPVSYDYRPVDERPFPDYEPFGIQEMLKYSMATRLLYRYSRPYPIPMMIVTARGCPFNCSFCKHSEDHTYRPRSIENIMQEIKFLYDNYKFNVLIIDDELFAVNKQRMRDFCISLIGNKECHGWDFDWMFQTHANAKFDLETLKLAKQSGCYLFSYGIESASPTVLKSMNKKVNVSQFIEAINLSTEAGIGFAGNLIFGDIAETEDTIRETMDFYFKYGLDHFVFLASVRPYPGSKLFNDCLEKGIIWNKLVFYEHIDEGEWNMTSMQDAVLERWLQLFITLESNFMLFKSVEAYRVEKDDESNPLTEFYGLSMTKIWAKCPFCGEEMFARNCFPSKFAFLITGCTHCGRRVRININMEG